MKLIRHAYVAIAVLGVAGRAIFGFGSGKPAKCSLSSEGDGETGYAKADRSAWLLEEYKLLSSHYFHEDGQLFRTVGIFGALNGALLAFLGSRFAEMQAPAVQFIPVIGIVLCLGWTAMIIRIREWRNYMEFRIREIEAELHGSWAGGAVPLDIRTVRRWSERRPPFKWYNWPVLPFYLAFRDASASLVLLLLPFAFAAVWVVLMLTGAI